MIDTIYSMPESPDFMVIWDLGRRCNFDCSYCTAWMHSTTQPFEKLESMKKTLSFIDQYWALLSTYHKHKNWKLKISFTGGEPSINPDFYPLVELIKKNHPNFILNLTTNGTWGERRGNFLIDNFDSITVSYHCEGPEKAKQQCRNNLLFLKDKGYEKVRVNVMMHVDHWDECVDLIENFLKPNNIKYTPRTIGDDDLNHYDWFKDKDGVMRRTTHLYSSDQLDYIKNHWNQKNKEVNKSAKAIESVDSQVNKTGRMCCGGRCMTVRDSGVESDAMFIQSDGKFQGWNCMINWFFLHIEQERDAIYHHQTCRAKWDGTTGIITTISESDKYLDWLENKFIEGKTPTMVCPNKVCGCGICIPKSKDLDKFKEVANKFIFVRDISV